MFFYRNSQFQDGFNELQALMDYDPISRNCSIIINDLTESDSGSYFSFFGGQQNSPPLRMTVAVKGMESYIKICTADVVIPPPKKNINKGNTSAF